MQILKLSDGWMFAVFFTLWPLFQIAAALICAKIPERILSPEGFLFKSHRWEKNGGIYETLFKVRKWKRFLPDGAAVTKNGYRKKHLTDYSEENFKRFIVESCRAELMHLVSILPFWIFGLFAPPIFILYMLIYALVVNLPCIIAQRYNRPRFLRVLRRAGRVPPSE